MPVIVIANQEGGVGKTTTTLNLGAALQEEGKRVLLVDLDPLAHLTIATGLHEPDGLSPTIGDLLAATTGARNGARSTALSAVLSTPVGLDLIPSNVALSAAELALVSALSRETALREVLAPLVDEYDYLLLDCLPSLSLLAINALTAADGIIIPVRADFLAMQGLAQILETVGSVHERLNPSLQIYGFLLTMVDTRTAHASHIVSVIRRSFDRKLPVFESEVRREVVLEDSAKAGQSILRLDSASPGAETYRRLAGEVLSIVEGRAAQVSGSNSQTRGSNSAPEETMPADTVATTGVAAAPTDAPAWGESERARVEERAGGQQVAAAVERTSTLAPELERAQAAADGRQSFQEFLVGREAWLGSASD